MSSVNSKDGFRACCLETFQRSADHIHPRKFQDFGSATGIRSCLHSPPFITCIDILSYHSGRPSLNHISSFNPNTLLVTGGAGFIGSNFIRFLVEKKNFTGKLILLDKLTYAGNLENLSGLESRFIFVHCDVCDGECVRRTLKEHNVDGIIHFAAESHVDRSILGPLVFTETNVLGTHTMLQAARENGIQRFLHISTDEVYGSLGLTGAFTEQSPIVPTSPYASSKAASDLFVLSYVKTFDFPALITRCSNNYGPYQFPEKLIPLMIINALQDKKLPVYGDGLNVRDWIHTEDHSEAIWTVFEKGEIGEVYNVGCNNEWHNIDIVKLILQTIGKPESLIQYVKDRPAHDRRYAIDSSKIQNELGWSPAISFDEGIRATIAWYVANETWWKRVISGQYLKYYEEQYITRIQP